MSSPNQLSERVAAQIAPLLSEQSRILIGLSGGVDSVVLLHLLDRLAVNKSWQLAALHVHHGISPNADEWVSFCVELCASYQIPLTIEHVDIGPLREQHGIEAAARKLRHVAFSKQNCDVVALAHHVDDQNETMLLQLLRGAGVRGASAMPVFTKRDGSFGLLRPLLNCTRQEIVDYAAMHRLQWIEDESNTNDSYPRNFLRHRVLPLLGERFPAYRDTLVRSAQHFAEASNLLDELAQQDAAQSILDSTLAITTLQKLSLPRAKNLLRYFLHSLGAPMPQAVQLDEILRQLRNARDDAAVCIKFEDWQLHRYQGKVYVLHALGVYEKGRVVSWHGEAELDWPALNARLRFKNVPGQGISVERLHRAPVTLRFRQGGETLRPQLKASNRTLKNLLQEQQIPPWQRDRLPLLYCGDELVSVPGVAVAAMYQADAEEVGMSVVVENIPRRCS